MDKDRLAWELEKKIEAMPEEERTGIIQSILSVGNGTETIEEPKPTTATKDNELHTAVRDIMLREGMKAFDRHREVAALVNTQLGNHGSFLRTYDGRLFYFRNEDRQLLDLEQRPFTRFLTNTFNLSATETVTRFVLDLLQANVSHCGTLSEIHSLSHYDPETGLLAVSNGSGGIWIREPRGKWEERQNGDDGILFLTDPDASPWVPEFGSESDDLKWFLGLIPFSEEFLEKEDSQMFLLIWLLQQFFPRLRRTRMIPAFLGPHGSGKTSTCRLMGRTLVGENFDVSGLRREKEDAFIAAVTNRVVVAVDNADTKIDWLEDALARYATGERYRMRRLYTTNEEVSYSPRAILLLTSRDPHFHRSDVSERLLPFYLARLEKFVDEETLHRNLNNRRGSIWRDILTQIARAADALRATPAPTLSFRMADFASFGWRILKPIGAADEWLDAVRKLDRSQMSFAAEGDGMISALEVLLENNPQIGPISVRELYASLRDIADSHGFSIPKTVDGFGKKLTTTRRIIEMELGVTCSEDRGHGRKRRVTIKKKGS